MFLGANSAMMTKTNKLLEVNTANGITNDAGKRRVQADGQGTGHWFTNGDGKRVSWKVLVLLL